jgi:predicted DNA-binding transcriptional regulator YafY
MKYTNLLKILMLLLANQKVSARELSNRYGVSTRTIYRYIDELCYAGIPVYMERGRYGGICLSETYKLPVGYLTKGEYDAAINALKAMSFQVSDENLLAALEKLERQVKNERQDMSVCGNILVDSSSWSGGKDFSDKMKICEYALNNCRTLDMDYISREGECTHREIEPYVLIYKENVWYLYAFCHLKNDFRTFKVGRIRGVTITEKTFVKQEIKREDIPLSFSYSPEHMLQVTLQIDKESLPDVEDWLGVENIKPKGNKLVAELSLNDDQTLVHKILSFGGAVKVLAPTSLKDKVKEAARAVLEEY